jgi:D-alanine--poly(phosphoribitol) ligase subunit 2
MSHDLYFCDQLKTLFLEKLHVEVPSVETDLFEEGVLDSMQFVHLLSYLEDKFGITISLNDIDFDNFRCIIKIAEFVGRHTSMKTTR